jgi:hypothetical protein
MQTAGLGMNKREFVGQESPSGVNQCGTQRAFPGSGRGRKNNGFAPVFGHRRMKDHKTLRAVANAVVQSPFEQRSRERDRQRKVRTAAIDNQDGLAPEPSVKSSTADDRQVEMTVSRQRLWKVAIKQLDMPPNGRQFRPDPDEEWTDPQLHARVEECLGEGTSNH